MTDIIKQLGLGFVLEFTDKTSKEVSTARKQIQGMKSDVSDMTKSFGSNIEKLEKQFETSRKIMSQSWKVAAAGAAVMTPFVLSAREAIKDEEVWSRWGASLIAQGEGIGEASKLIGIYQDRVDALGNSIIALPMEDLDKSFAILQKKLGTDMAMPALERAGMLAEVTGSNAQMTSDIVANMLQTFGPAMRTLTDIEKIDKITNVIAGTTGKYGLAVDDLGDGLRFVSKNVGVMNLGLEETVALMAPLLAKGIPGRMAGSSINMMLSNFLQFEEKIKELKKSGKKEGITVGDLLGRTEATIPADVQALANIKMTDAAGQLRKPVEILKEIEKRLGITKTKSKQVQEQMAKGLVSRENVMGAFNLSASQQAFLQKMLGDEIGLWLGNADAIDENSRTLKASNSLQDQFALVSKTTTHSLGLARNQTNNLAEDTGKNLTPAIKDATDAYGWLTKAVSAFMALHPDLAKVLTLTGAGGGMLLSAGGTAASIAGPLITWSIGRKLLKAQKEALNAGKAVAEQVGKGGGAARLAPWEKAATEITKQSAKESLALGGMARTAGAFAGRAAARVGGGFVTAAAWPEHLGAPKLSDVGAMELLQGEAAWQRSNFEFPLGGGLESFMGTAVRRSPFQATGSDGENSVVAKLDSIDRTLMEMRDGRVSPNGMISDSLSGKTEAGKSQVIQSFSGNNFYIVPPAGADPSEYLQMFEKYTRDQADRSATGKF